MAASAKSGSQIIFGNLSAMLAAVFGSPVPDPDQDAGPSAVYQGWSILDPRILYTKDKVTGYTGVVPSYLMQPKFRSIGAIPAGISTSNIAAGAHAVANTPLVLASAQVAGVATNVPIRPYAQVLNANAPVTAAIALDFGFAFGNCTAGSATIQVSNSARFSLGMPLVIPNVGNSAGTSALLTQVASIVDATHITVNSSAVPQHSNATAAIGTGDLWGPSEVGFPLPLAACPFLAQGPGLFLDSRQSITRAVSITGVGGGSGGTVLVSGWDLYGQPMSELITVGSGAVTGYGKKAFKYIGSVVPTFSDANNYSVGTSDTFGFAFSSNLWEETAVAWDAAAMTAVTGWTAADATAPTTTTGDVRGTIQTSADGAGSGIGSTPSNGTISGLVMTGNRLEMGQFLGISQTLTATQANPVPLFGNTQA